MENRTPEEREAFARMGGQVGGKRRARALTKERRQEIARNPPHPPDDEEFGDEIEPEPPEEEQGEQTAMPAAPSLLRHCFLPHRAEAALRAISWRRSFVRARARRFPPTWPPMRANASLSSGVRFSIEVSPPFLAISWRSSLDKTSARRLPPRLPRATACGFFPTLLSVPPKPK